MFRVHETIGGRVAVRIDRSTEPPPSPVLKAKAARVQTRGSAAMFTTLHHGTRPAVLFFYFALGLVIAGSCPDDRWAGLVLGEREGTGAGGRTGVLRNQSGSMSGVGPGSSSGIFEAGLYPLYSPAPGRAGIFGFWAWSGRDVPQRSLFDPLHGARTAGDPGRSERTDLCDGGRLGERPDDRDGRRA